MSQQEIMELLEKEKRPLSRREIAEKLESDPNKISELLRKLLCSNSINCTEIDRHEAKRLYKDSAPLRKLKLYFT